MIFFEHFSDLYFLKLVLMVENTAWLAVNEAVFNYLTGWRGRSFIRELCYI